MSFEGYYQALCEEGHYEELDWCSLVHNEGIEEYHCTGIKNNRECKKKIFWYNLVNDTNLDDYGLLEITEDSPETVGNDETYHIPDKGVLI